MTKAFIYDFETQHLPLFSAPSEDPGQPHIVSACAELIDVETRKVLAGLNLIAKPDGWVIPDETAKIHGITTIIANECGVPEHIIVQAMIGMWQQADLRVAHNESFDARIMRIALKRFRIAGHDLIDEAVWADGAAECTARKSTSIINLPPTERMIRAGRRHAKMPNLTEAFEFFTGEKMVDAHTADADVRACKAVFFAIRDREDPFI